VAPGNAVAGRGCWLLLHPFLCLAGPAGEQSILHRGCSHVASGHVLDNMLEYRRVRKLACVGGVVVGVCVCREFSVVSLLVCSCPGLSHRSWRYLMMIAILGLYPGFVCSTVQRPVSCCDQFGPALQGRLSRCRNQGEVYRKLDVCDVQLAAAWQARGAAQLAPHFRQATPSCVTT